MTIDPHALRSESFAEVGTLIQRDAAAIIASWSRRAIVEQPQAARVHHQTLLDHLPLFLEELSRSLIEAGNADVAHHRRPAKEHGAQRWDAGWSPTEVVRDYQILRLVLLDHLETALNRPLASREHKAIGLALDEAIGASIAAYVAHREDHARTAAEELRRRTAQMEEAHRHKDEFLAIMSHELRNPLAPLRNALHVLSLDTAPATVAWARGLMDRQLQMLTRLVDDLMDVSRIARGKIGLRRQRLDLVRLVQLTAEDRRAGFVGAGVELVVQTPPGPLWVQGEATRLAQVVGNLLHNAQKFTDRGGRVDVTVQQPDAGHVQVAVRDTGVGIAPAMLPRIFEAFTQGDRQLDRRGGGLGLGLALVKGLVELHGGRVEAHSAGLGQGVEVRFTLPLAEAVPL